MMFIKINEIIVVCINNDIYNKYVYFWIMCDIGYILIYLYVYGILYF